MEKFREKIFKKGIHIMMLRKLKKVILPTAAIGVFSAMTVLAASAVYTIEDPVITTDYPEEYVVRTTIDMAMTAEPAESIALSVTPYYSLRGSSNLIQDTTKWISSGSEKVTLLEGKAEYSFEMPSHKVYVKYEQKGYVNNSGEYSLVTEKTTP